MVVGNCCKLELEILFLLTCLSEGSDIVDVKFGFRCLPFAFIVLLEKLTFMMRSDVIKCLKR